MVFRKAIVFALMVDDWILMCHLEIPKVLQFSPDRAGREVAFVNDVGLSTLGAQF